VTRAIRYAMTRIGEHHPLLGEHLNLAIRTGTYCGYLPDPRAVAAWKFSPPGAASSGVKSSSAGVERPTSTSTSPTNA
jgi:hypothetical protein